MAGTRKLAAILASDVVGYSRLAGADEDRTLARLRALRSDLVDPTISVHHGRVVKRTGDGSLIEFRSVVDAVDARLRYKTRWSSAMSASLWTSALSSELESIWATSSRKATDHGRRRLLGHVEIQRQIELQRDDRGRRGTERGHLLQDGNLAELHLKRRRHRGRHHLRARARIKCPHLDRRVVDVGQGRDRQEAHRDEADKHESNHQKSRGGSAGRSRPSRRARPNGVCPKIRTVVSPLHPPDPERAYFSKASGSRHEAGRLRSFHCGAAL